MGWVQMFRLIWIENGVVTIWQVFLFFAILWLLLLGEGQPQCKPRGTPSDYPQDQFASDPFYVKLVDLTFLDLLSKSMSNGFKWFRINLGSSFSSPFSEWKVHGPAAMLKP